MKLNHLLTGMIIAGCSVLGTTAHAAPITWQPAQDTTGPADVVAGGQVIVAINASKVEETLGNTYTVSDVTFITQSVLSIDGFAGTVDVLRGATSGDEDYDAIIGTHDHHTGDGTVNPAILSIEGLTDGVEYFIQVWYTDNRNLQSGDRIMQIGDLESPSNVVDLHRNSPLGQYALGRFTASGTSQGLSLESLSQANAHFNALLVREVPEPASVALLGLGGIVMLSRRRQR